MAAAASRRAALFVVLGNFAPRPFTRAFAYSRSDHRAESHAGLLRADEDLVARSIRIPGDHRNEGQRRESRTNTRPRGLERRRRRREEREKKDEELEGQGHEWLCRGGRKRRVEGGGRIEDAEESEDALERRQTAEGWRVCEQRRCKRVDERGRRVSADWGAKARGMPVGRENGRKVCALVEQRGKN